MAEELIEDAEEVTVTLEPGLLINKRWKVLKKLGEGGCGSVYKVMDIKTKSAAAFKVEANNQADGGVLKLEVKILKRMTGRQHVAHLLQAGKKAQYSYMVTDLLGASLEKLTLKKGKASTISTQVRVGMQCLFGLKQLHEVGFVHRDVKPANIAIGYRGAETRILHLLDFGLAREFTIRTKKKIRIREPRTDVLFRGTMHYASARALQGHEQGRVDDLWSMVYVMAELRDRLPWTGSSTKEDFYKLKEDTNDTELFYNSIQKLTEIPSHLRTLEYQSRPDYFLMYNTFNGIMTASKFSHSDPFDWEIDGGEGGSPAGKKSVRILECEPKTIFPKGPAEEIIEFSDEAPMDDDPDILKEIPKATLKKRKSKSKSPSPKPKSPSPKSPSPSPREGSDAPKTCPKTCEGVKSPQIAKLFSAADFKKNELGF